MVERAAGSSAAGMGSNLTSCSLWVMLRARGLHSLVRSVEAVWELLGGGGHGARYLTAIPSTLSYPLLEAGFLPEQPPAPRTKVDGAGHARCAVYGLPAPPPALLPRPHPGPQQPHHLW